MLSEDQVVDRLIAICPRFVDSFQAYLNQGGDRNEYYNVMAELARWVGNRLLGQQRGCLQELFDELEALLPHATRPARDVLVIGFLEDIYLGYVRHPGAHSTVNADLFLSFLGPRSRLAWSELIGQWKP